MTISALTGCAASQAAAPPPTPEAAAPATAAPPATALSSPEQGAKAATPPQEISTATPTPEPSAAPVGVLRGSGTPAVVRTHAPSPPAEAAEHLDGCDKGDLAACHAAALDAYYRPRSPTTDRAAFDLFQKACDGGYAPSCNGLGVLHGEGRGVIKDPARAADLYRKACIGGGSTACQHLENALRDGLGVARSTAAADRARIRGRCLSQAMDDKKKVSSCPAL